MRSEIDQFQFNVTVTKGPYFNYVSMFLTISDQLSNLVSMLTK